MTGLSFAEFLASVKQHFSTAPGYAPWITAYKKAAEEGNGSSIDPVKVLQTLPTQLQGDAAQVASQIWARYQAEVAMSPTATSLQHQTAVVLAGEAPSSLGTNPPRTADISPSAPPALVAENLMSSEAPPVIGAILLADTATMRDPVNGAVWSLGSQGVMIVPPALMDEEPVFDLAAFAPLESKGVAVHVHTTPNGQAFTVTVTQNLEGDDAKTFVNAVLAVSQGPFRSLFDTHSYGKGGSSIPLLIRPRGNTRYTWVVKGDQQTQFILTERNPFTQEMHEIVHADLSGYPPSPLVVINLYNPTQGSNSRVPRYFTVTSGEDGRASVVEDLEGSTTRSAMGLATDWRIDYRNPLFSAAAEPDLLQKTEFRFTIPVTKAAGQAHQQALGIAASDTFHPHFLIDTAMTESYKPIFVRAFGVDAERLINWRENVRILAPLQEGEVTARLFVVEVTDRNLPSKPFQATVPQGRHLVAYVHFLQNGRVVAQFVANPVSRTDVADVPKGKSQHLAGVKPRPGFANELFRRFLNEVPALTPAQVPTAVGAHLIPENAGHLFSPYDANSIHRWWARATLAGFTKGPILQGRANWSRAVQEVQNALNGGDAFLYAGSIVHYTNTLPLSVGTTVHWRAQLVRSGIDPATGQYLEQYSVELFTLRQIGQRTKELPLASMEYFKRNPAAEEAHHTAEAERTAIAAGEARIRRDEYRRAVEQALATVDAEAQQKRILSFTPTQFGEGYAPDPENPRIFKSKDKSDVEIIFLGEEGFNPEYADWVASQLSERNAGVDIPYPVAVWMRDGKPYRFWVQIRNGSPEGRPTVVNVPPQEAARWEEAWKNFGPEGMPAIRQVLGAFAYEADRMEGPYLIAHHTTDPAHHRVVVLPIGHRLYVVRPDQMGNRSLAEIEASLRGENYLPLPEGVQNISQDWPEVAAKIEKQALAIVEDIKAGVRAIKEAVGAVRDAIREATAEERAHHNFPPPNHLANSQVSPEVIGLLRSLRQVPAAEALAAGRELPSGSPPLDELIQNALEANGGEEGPHGLLLMALRSCGSLHARDADRPGASSVSLQAYRLELIRRHAAHDPISDSSTFSVQVLADMRKEAARAEEAPAKLSEGLGKDTLRREEIRAEEKLEKDRDKDRAP